MRVFTKRLPAIFCAALCSLFFCVSNAAAFFEEQFYDQNDNLNYSQQNYDSEPPAAMEIANPEPIQFAQPQVSDSQGAADISGVSDFSQPITVPAIPLPEPGSLSAETNETLTQSLLLQELLAPFTADTRLFNNADLGPYSYLKPETFYSIDDATGYSDPFNLIYEGLNRPSSLSKYPFKNYNDYLNDPNDPYSLNNPMLQFYFDNPNLAPEDWLDQFGTGQKYRFKKFKPLKPIGVVQY